MPIVRTNYKMNAKSFVDASILCRIRQSWQLDSATGDIYTMSVDGLGYPAWVRVEILSLAGGTIILPLNYCIDQSTSLVYVSLYAVPMTYTNIGSYSLGSIGATTTIVADILTLIGSR